MAAGINRRIVLKSRPDGAPGLNNFELVRGPVPEPAEGEVLMRTRYLSLDPYMRGRMSAAKSYAKPVEIGEPMVAGTVGEIVASRNAKFAVGDIVLGYGGWQDYALSGGVGVLSTLMPAAPKPWMTRPAISMVMFPAPPQMPPPSIKTAVETMMGHRRPKMLASCPERGCSEVLSSVQ